MKIGLMGGTFDPVHIGHLIAAQSVYEELELDEVWFMPTSMPPHKEQAPGASPEQRWQMVCLAVEDHPAFKHRMSNCAKAAYPTASRPYSCSVPGTLNMSSITSLERIWCSICPNGTESTS